MRKNNISNLPKKIEVSLNGLSIVDSELKGKIIATANSEEIAKEIVDVWNRKNEKQPINFSDEQKNYLIQKLKEHWDVAGDSSHWEGIKMAQRVIRKL